YERNGEADAAECDADALDDFKASLYMSLERLQSESAKRLRTPEVRAICKAIYEGGIAETDEIDHFASYVASKLDLVGLDHETDESFAQMATTCLPPAARTELVQAYVGFPFFDVLTLSLNKWQDLDDVDTVQVDRISP